MQHLLLPLGNIKLYLCRWERINCQLPACRYNKRYLIKGSISKKKNLLKTKCVSLLSLQLLSETFTWSKMYFSSSCYTTQLMHYSHFKTQSLPHLKPIKCQRTQISGRNSNDTKHSGGPPEDGRGKRQKHVGVLYLQTRF